MRRPTVRRLLTFGLPVLVALAAVTVVIEWRAHAISEDPAALLKRLPTQDAVVVGINFQELRRSGFVREFLSARTAPEADYAAFVRDTGFNYERDLDYVLASFAPDGEFFLAKGRFDWPKLESYALAQRGSCFDHLCRVSGSTPDRKISFFPLAGNLLAMAVAPDDTAAARLQRMGPQADIDVSPQPVWLSVSSGVLRHSASLPGRSQLFASAMQDANRVSLALGPSGSNVAARLEAICRDPQQAGALTMQLRMVTAMLRNAGQSEETPSPAGSDLAGLLASGTFDQAGSHVVGRWNIPHAFLQSLAGGD